jgi:HEAT repeat protein
MFGRNARDSLFLVYFGSQYLPYMYFANAVFLVFTSLIYTALMDRIDRGRLLGGLSLVFASSLIASRLVLSEHPHWFFPVLYIQSQVIWYFSLMQFWTFIGELFDTRQAKRVFPLLAIGALLGMISVGLSSQKLVHAAGSENLLLVWAGLILAASILGTIIHQRYRTIKGPAKTDLASASSRPRPSEWQKFKDGFREVGSEPLLRSMSGYILLLWTVYAVVDFCFNQSMNAKYPNPNELTTFFGRFVGAQGFLCLVIQIFFTRVVISWVGVGTTINFHPAFLVLGTAWMGFQYGYPSVLITKLGDATMLYTFSDSSYQLLYNPVPPDRRARVRGFIEGYIRPLSLAAAGILVLAGNSYLRPLHLSSGKVILVGQQLSWGAFVIAGVWLGFAMTAKKGYIRALLRNLQGDSPGLRQAAATALSKLKNLASLSILSETLQSEIPARVITAVKFLETFRTRDAKEAIAALLTHPDPGVRATAVGALGRLGGGEFSECLTPLLQDSDARVRANTIEALAATRDPSVIEKLRPLLQDSSTRARINTVLSIAAIQGVAAAVDGLPFALGRLPLAESIDLLAELLKDPILKIRCEAAEALGRIGSPRGIPDLVQALAGPPELRHSVRRSLAAIAQKYGGEPARELVKRALTADRPEIRSELADVLGRLKGPQVIETLIALLKDPEWRVRWKVLKSFSRLARSGPLPESARVALFDYARRELANFRQSVLWSQTLLPNPRSPAECVLAQALEEDRAKIEERVFNMLGIVCGRDRMIVIYEKLNSGDRRMKADALEALDNLAPKPLAREVLQSLEPPPIANGMVVRTVAPLLAALSTHPKSWIRACTAYYLGYHSQGDREGLLKARLKDSDRVVRETALYAGWLAFDGAWRPLVEQTYHSRDVALRRVAHRILRSIGANPFRSTAGGSEPMLLTVEKVLFLKTVPLFAGLDGEELAALADIALEQEYQPGEIIFDQGQIAHHLYVIVRGKVEVFYRAGSIAHPVAVLGEKECFGEMAILDDEPRSATVRAAELTLALKVDRENFYELIHERPQVSFAIFKILTSRLRQKDLEAESPLTTDTPRQFA